MILFSKENLLKVLLSFNCLGMFLSYLYSYTTIFDNFEHIRASYFVSLGYLPYKDFFEHHHPMLWYVWSLVFKVLDENAVVMFYLAKAFALMLYCFTGRIIYKIIITFLGGRDLSLIFFLIVTSFFPIWYGVSLFKPDCVAVFFYFCALYLFFRYIELRQRKYLLSSFLLLSFAFLFLQTMVFNIFPLVFVMVCLFYNDGVFWRDISWSVLGCLFVLSLGGLFLYKNDILLTYIEQNWFFNLKLFSFVHEGASSLIWNWLYLIVLAFICAVILLKKEKNPYWMTIVFLFGCEVVRCFVIKVVYSHYLIMLLLFSGLLIAKVITMYNDKKVIRGVYFICFFNIVVNFVVLYLFNNVSLMKVFAEVNKKADCLVLNAPLKIYGPKISYYDLIAGNFSLLDDCMFHRLPNYNVNKLQEQYNFDYIFASKFGEKALSCDVNRFILDSKYSSFYEKISDNLYKRI